MKVAFALLQLLLSLEAFVQCHMRMAYYLLGEFIQAHENLGHVEYYAASMEAAED